MIVNGSAEIKDITAETGNGRSMLIFTTLLLWLVAVVSALGLHAGDVRADPPGSADVDESDESENPDISEWLNVDLSEYSVSVYQDEEDEEGNVIVISVTKWDPREEGVPKMLLIEVQRTAVNTYGYILTTLVAWPVTLGSGLIAVPPTENGPVLRIRLLDGERGVPEPENDDIIPPKVRDGDEMGYNKERRFLGNLTNPFNKQRRRSGRRSSGSGDTRTGSNSGQGSDPDSGQDIPADRGRDPNGPPPARTGRNGGGSGGREVNRVVMSPSGSSEDNSSGQEETEDSEESDSSSDEDSSSSDDSQDQSGAPASDPPPGPESDDEDSGCVNGRDARGNPCDDEEGEEGEQEGSSDPAPMCKPDSYNPEICDEEFYVPPEVREAMRRRIESDPSNPNGVGVTDPNPEDDSCENCPRMEFDRPNKGDIDPHPDGVDIPGGGGYFGPDHITIQNDLVIDPPRPQG